jgi:superfamily I DNA and RNA helicase
VNVDWALCFPQCSVVGQTGATGVPLNRIFDETRLVNISYELPKLEQEIRSTFGRKGMTPKESHDLVSRLTRSIGFVQILGVRFAREAEQLVQVTTEQCEVLADLEINPRMIVHGSAGTGKTIVAQEFAKRLAAKKRTVLLLFYNKGIAAKVRYAFERDSSVSVSTFSSFAKRLVKACDPAWWEAQTTKDDDFWQLSLPSRLLEIPADKQPQFDAIIVDEGQDFKPEWFEYLHTLLKPGADSQFCVFLDEHQDIFGHWKRFPCSPAPAKKILTKNCRNTKAIVSYLNQAYPTQMVSFEKSPGGVPIVEQVVRNDIEEQTQLVRDIKHLIANEQIQPGDIVVLLNSEKDKSSLADTKAIAGFPLVSTYARYDTTAKRIHYSTIEIFKGLEADVIFVLLGDGIPAADIPNALYVQGSRAKHALYIYRRG